MAGGLVGESAGLRAAQLDHFPPGLEREFKVLAGLAVEVDPEQAAHAHPEMTERYIIVKCMIVNSTNKYERDVE